MEEYAPNSFASKEPKQRDKKEPVVVGTAKVAKSAKGKDKVANFLKKIAIDYIVPGAKDIISDTLTNAVNIALYGDTRKTYRNTIPQSRVSYGKYYYDSERNMSPVSRGPKPDNINYDYNDVMLSSWEDAANVLAKMDETIQQYRCAKVADLYEFAHLENLIKYTDYNCGWTDLRTAQIIPQRDGYFLLKLPRPMSID